MPKGIYKHYDSNEIYKMVEVKIQKHPAGINNGKYFTYMITLPKTIIEATPQLARAKKLKVSINKGSIVLTP